MCDTRKDSFVVKLDNYEQTKSLVYAYIRENVVLKSVFITFF